MKKTLCLLFALILLLGLCCGCGSAKSASDTSMAPGYLSYNGEAKTDSMPVTEDFYGWDMPMAPAEIPEPESKPATSGAPASGTSLPGNTKLIYTANMDLESTEFDAATAGIAKLAAEMGGYFENNQTNNYGRYRSAYYTVRVPAEKFDAFCTAVGGLCQVNSIDRSAQDISEAYYDTEARLTTQQTKLARLQELLAKAENMEDIITIESAISDTEFAIENLTGTLRKYDSLVGYSTVHINLAEVYKLTEIEEPVIGFGAKLTEAFKSGCSRFVRNLESTMLDIARAWVGWLIFLVIVAVVVVLAVRTARRRKQKRQAAREAQLAQRARKPLSPEQKQKPEDE